MSLSNSINTATERLVRPLLGGLVALLLATTNHAIAANEPPAELLLRADNIKSSNYSQFEEILNLLRDRQNELSGEQRSYYQYLDAWRSAYLGDYDGAVNLLRTFTTTAATPTLEFRANSTMVNVLALAKRYEEAFGALTRMLELLPRVSDRNAREQGLAVASLFYNRVGQYRLALNYASMLLTENPSAHAACTGRQLKVEALYHLEGLQATNPEFQAGIEACTKADELLFANLIRLDLAKAQMDRGRYAEAVAMLKQHREEIFGTRYPQLIAEYHSLLATAYRQTGDPELVRQHAISAVESDLKSEYTEPLVNGYRLLYLLARERGDTKGALAYHEKYAAADKGYLDDISAKQLAFERVKHEAIADQLQFDALNKKNEVLELQQKLDKKAVETSRLYIALLILIAAFIAYFAYKTKRSQLHFMKLSQQDGLTGIANRPHFIYRAEAILEINRKTHQEVCVVLCDLDHFKAINDRYGHATGDHVLRQVVAEFRRHLRANDIFGRVGGEEFGVLLPGCSSEAARERCEQLRHALSELTIRFEEHDIRASASFGIESTSSCGYDLRQLLANADAALYQAKDAGRNCIKAYDSSMANTFTCMTTGRFRSSRDRFNQDFAVETK